MSEDTIRLVNIVSGARTGRSVANWFAVQATRYGGVELDVIDLTRTWLPDVTPELIAEDREQRPRAVCDLAPWLAAADGFVIVTGEHHGSFPALLKNTIDWFDTEWVNKPVGFISYGGPAQGLRAVAHLRLVFTCVGAVPVRAGVSLADTHPACTSRPDSISSGVDAAVGTMLGELGQWAGILRQHRATTNDG
ncbi:NADPH-dependent FMN reductase [Phytoactinopolyspora limicola]|uniref:NADPH-dependent FMN reductase n=1 Tax=Phytoactinopolyspora limicola TaxID=2715536 RepID=UPI00140D3436|nr:NAD(P)H-dependent oxidoreductase [Phytoactinopolyspora limicola]